MNTLINYLIIVILVVLTFLLLNLIIKKWFSVKKSRATSITYPIIKSLTVLIAAFIINNGIGNQLLEIIITFLNDNTLLSLDPNIVSSRSLISEIVFYICVSAITIVYSIFAFKEYKKTITNEVILIPEKTKIDFPKNDYILSPIFSERLKKIFELKNKAHGLKLTYDSKLSILYGEYSHGLYKYFIVIICHKSNFEINLPKNEIEQKLAQIKKDISNTNITIENDSIKEYYYILERGTIDSSSKNILCYTEDTLLNNLIDFSDYLEKLRASFKESKLPFTNREDVTLNNTFIKPNYFVSESKQVGNDLEDYLDNWIEEISYKHIVLLGDYGMGKSSFSKYYSEHVGTKILNSHKVVRFPILISLTNTSPRHGGIQNTISKFLTEHVGVTMEVFQELIHRGKILFILDGFDEMGFVGTNDQRIKQLNAIWQLATKNNKILISGRPSYFPNDDELKYAFNIQDVDTINKPINRPFFERLYLTSFQPEQILDSLRFYYSEEKSQEYFMFIKSNKSLLEICKRPSMMHIVREMIPDIIEKLNTEKLSAGKLMDFYIEHWIERQLEKKIISAVEDKKIKKQFVTDFFIDLASIYYERNVEKISADEIISLLKEDLSKLKLKNKDDIEGFESELLTGYFIEIDNDEYKFVHKSFKEFLISKKIINLLSKKQFNHPLILKKDWTAEIIDFVYDSKDIMKVREKPDKIPALLRLTCSNIFEVNFKRMIFYYKVHVFYFLSLSNKMAAYLLTPILEKVILFRKEELESYNEMKIHYQKYKSSPPDSKESSVFLKYLELNLTILAKLGLLFNEPRNEINLTTKAYYIALLKGELDVNKNKIIVNYIRNEVGKELG